MTLILGLYGTTNVWLGPNSSFLIKPTSVFVQNVIVEELGNKGSGLMLYGMKQPPKLDVLDNWSEIRYLAVPNDSYKISSASAILLAAILLLVLPDDPSTVAIHGLILVLLGLFVSWNAPATNKEIKNKRLRIG